jgi:predicted metal-dependent phosphoesterase TrpH
VLAVELHAHSDASYDGRDSVEQLLERAREVGLDALAVTDHDEFAESQRAAALAPEYGLVGIPAMEVSSAAGHILAFDIDTAIDPGLPYEETIGRIHEQGGTAIVPHPFQEMRSGVLAKIPKSKLGLADAIEVYNSRLVTGWSNRQAKRYAQRETIPMIAGSDAHVSEMVGRSVTRVDANERSAEAILEAVRDGRTVLESRRTPWSVSFRQAVGNTRRRIRLFVSSLRS